MKFDWEEFEGEIKELIRNKDKTIANKIDKEIYSILEDDDAVDEMTGSAYFFIVDEDDNPVATISFDVKINDGYVSGIDKKSFELKHVSDSNERKEK